MTELNNELERMAQVGVVLTPLPPEIQTIEDEIAEKQEEFKQYHEGEVHDQVLHDQIRDDLAALKVQNEQIIEENLAEITRVNQENAVAFAAYIADPVNIATAQNTVTRRIYDMEIAQYDYQFVELSRAYMAALILGDEISMAENRAAYQALLTEYNTKIVEVP